MKLIKKNLLLMPFVLGATLFVYSQDKASGAREEMTLIFDNFNEIEVSGPFHVTLVKGDQAKVKFETIGAIALNEVDVTTHKGTLSMKLKEPNKKKRNIEAEDFVEVLVQYNDEIEEIKASVGAKIRTKNTLQTSDEIRLDVSSGASLNFNVKAKECKVESSSGSYVEIQIDAKTFDIKASSGAEIDAHIADSNSGNLKASSGSKITIEGISEKMDFDASSSGDINAQKLVVKKAKVDASSAAKIILQVSKELEASASSGAEVKYEALKESLDSIETNSSSGGSIKKI